MIRKKKESSPESVTYSQPFAAKIVQEGALNKLVVKNQRWYQYQLQKFKPGMEVTLVINNRKPKRTEQQNRYYWGVYLQLIAEKTGEHELDQLHELFKGKFLTEAIVEVLGEKVRIKKSTAELSTTEFGEYIMNIEEMTGVEAPPTENYSLINLDEGLKLRSIEDVEK